MTSDDIKLKNLVLIQYDEDNKLVVKLFNTISKFNYQWL